MPGRRLRDSLQSHYLTSSPRTPPPVARLPQNATGKTTDLLEARAETGRSALPNDDCVGHAGRAIADRNTASGPAARTMPQPGQLPGRARKTFGPVEARARGGGGEFMIELNRRLVQSGMDSV